MDTIRTGTRSWALHVTRGRGGCLVLGLLVACGSPSAPEENRSAWEAGPPLPTPLFGMAAVTYRGSVWVAGGGGVNQGSDVVYRLDAAGGWEEATRLPDRLGAVQLAVAADSLYLFAASTEMADGFQVPNSRIWVLNPATATWSERSGLPDQRRLWRVVGVGEKIVLVGGEVSGGGTMRTVADTAAIYEAGPGQWHYSTTAMEVPRAAPFGAAINGSVYVFSGFPVGGVGLALTVERYDVEADAWTTLAEQPPGALTTELNQAVAVEGGVVHVLGGRSQGTGAVVSPDHLVFDPAAGTWSFGDLLPVGRSAAGAAAVGGVVYVVGGLSSLSPFRVTDRVDVLRP